MVKKNVMYTTSGSEHERPKDNIDYLAFIFNISGCHPSDPGGNEGYDKMIKNQWVNPADGKITSLGQDTLRRKLEEEFG